MEPFIVEIRNAFPIRSSRPSGREARAFVMALLNEHDRVKLDFICVSLTPSFADELVGILAAELGRSDFEKRVILDGMSGDTAALIRHVVSRRLRDQPKQLDIA